MIPLLESMLGEIVTARTWFGILMSVIGISMLECSGSAPNVRVVFHSILQCNKLKEDRNLIRLSVHYLIPFFSDWRSLQLSQCHILWHSYAPDTAYFHDNEKREHLGTSRIRGSFHCLKFEYPNDQTNQDMSVD